MTRAYSLEQQNAGLAHTGLCHASSCNTNQVTLLTAGAWSTRQADVNDAYRRDVAYKMSRSMPPLLWLTVMMMLAMVSCHVDALTQFITECHPPDDVSRPLWNHTRVNLY